MNICFITSVFLPEVTGVSNHLYNMAGHFSRLGHKVLLLCPDYGIEKDIYPGYAQYRGDIFENVTVRPVPSQKNMRRPESVNYQEGKLWSLAQVIGDFKPDIIQVEDPDRIYGLRLFGLEETIAYNNPIGVDYARSNNIPVVGFYQTNFAAFADCYIPLEVPTPYRINPAGVYEKIYADYDEVLCACEDAYRHLVNHGLKKVRWGEYLGIDESVLETGAKSTLIAHNNKTKLLYSGRFDGGKDVKIVIEIFKKAHAKNSQLRLYLAGTGMRGTMEYVVKECSENSDIVYVGSLAINELAKVYNSVDVYFSPHKTDALGVSIVEAMAKGLPVIAADKGGPASLINNGINGILCAEDDDFIQQIVLLAGNEALRRTLGRNAEHTAQKYYGRNCAANLIDTYRGLINRIDSNGKD